MSEYCGASPCDALIKSRAHGRWIFDSTPKEKNITWVILVSGGVKRLDKPEVHVIEYCPFCGSKLKTERPKGSYRDFMKKPGRVVG